MEPQIHSHISDSLPADHQLAERDIFCADCGVMVHASNNECMRTWVELANPKHILAGCRCLQCFASHPACLTL
jgi:hypothetical protein